MPKYCGLPIDILNITGREREVDALVGVFLINCEI